MALVSQTTTFSGKDLTSSGSTGGPELASFTPAVDSYITLMISLTGLNSGGENLTMRMRLFNASSAFLGARTSVAQAKEANTDTTSIVFPGQVPLNILVPANFTLKIHCIGTISTNAGGTVYFIDLGSATEVRGQIGATQSFNNTGQSSNLPAQVKAIDAGLINSTAAPNLDAAISSRMASFTLPGNFALLAVDGSGRVTTANPGGSSQNNVTVDMTEIRG